MSEGCFLNSNTTGLRRGLAAACFGFLAALGRLADFFGKVLEFDE